MRKLGVGILGLFAGLLAGLLVTEIVARIAMAGRDQLPESLPLAILLGFAPPTLAVVGVVVGLVIDSQVRR